MSESSLRDRVAKVLGQHDQRMVRLSPGQHENAIDDSVYDALGEIREALSTAPDDEVRSVLADRTALAQAIHDARGILGFDNDGDDHPHTNDFIGYAEFHRRDATEQRKDYDALTAEVERLEDVARFATQLADSYLDELNDCRRDLQTMSARIGYALMKQAADRFDKFGPHDARGAAFWDSYTGLMEGRLQIPDSLPDGWAGGSRG